MSKGRQLAAGLQPAWGLVMTVRHLLSCPLAAGRHDQRGDGRGGCQLPAGLRHQVGVRVGPGHARQVVDRCI